MNAREVSLQKWGKALECADNWKAIVRIYKEDVSQGYTPAATAGRIVSELGRDSTLATFSTVARIKEHDGRIYGRNRQIMDQTPFVAEAVEWVCGNPMVHAGIDDIHTTHVNQLITELVKEERN